MKKLEYLKKFVLANRYRYKKLIIDLFALRRSSQFDRNETNAYRIVRDATGVFFIDPENDYSNTKLEDADIKSPLFQFSDRLTIDNTWIPNVDKQTETSIGNLLFNLVSIVPAFGNKIPFILGKASVHTVEDIVATKLKDTPPTDSNRDPNFIYVDEYLKFIDSLEFIKGWAQIATIALTAKTITPPPGMKEFKANLVKKYGDKLSDPVYVAQMEKEMAQYDLEYLKDDPSLGKFNSGKMLTTVRKKLFHSIGTNRGFKYSATVKPIMNSLSDGQPTDPIGFSASINDSRIGSYSRGAETVNGGVVAKGLLRASNFIKIVEEDCGTKLGLMRRFTEKDIDQLIGRYILDNKKSILITKDTAKQYINKDVEVRSNMYCKSNGVTYCKYCSGENLSRNENGVIIGFTEFSGAILGASMGAMHASELKVAKLDIKTCFK